MNVSPPEAVKLTGPDVLGTTCAASTIYFVSFLPDILDTKVEGRDRYLKQLMFATEKIKRSSYSYTWAATGKHLALNSRCWWL